MWDSCSGHEMSVWQREARLEMLKRWNPTFHGEGVRSSSAVNSTIFPLVIFILLLSGGSFSCFIVASNYVCCSLARCSSWCLLRVHLHHIPSLDTCKFCHIWVTEASNMDSSPSKHLITVRFPNERNLGMCVCVCQGGLPSGVGEKLPHPRQHHPINTTDVHTHTHTHTHTHPHMHKQCGCRHRRVSWPQRAECLSQLISIGMKWRLVEVVLCFSWSLTKQEAHSDSANHPASSTYTKHLHHRHKPICFQANTSSIPKQNKAEV